MPEEVRLWRIASEHKLQEIEPASLDFEMRLQAWIAEDISVLDRDLLVIGKEVTTDFGQSIDILCIDVNGDLVVVETKRDKTPRETVAQALDYASWVANLSYDRIVAIAEDYLSRAGSSFSESFRNNFGEEVPDTLNGDHSIIIVGSQIDSCTERIVKYLSEKHGVNINVATFQFFSGPEGEEYLARIFLIEPEDVGGNVPSKVRHNLTFEELRDHSWQNGVQELYDHAVAKFGTVFSRGRTQSSISFKAQFQSSRKVVISLLPGKSGQTEGLHFQIYINRFADFLGISSTELTGLLPISRKEWAYADLPDRDYQGYEGFFQNTEEIDRLASLLHKGSQHASENE